MLIGWLNIVHVETFLESRDAFVVCACTCHIVVSSGTHTQTIGQPTSHFLGFAMSAVALDVEKLHKETQIQLKHRWPWNTVMRARIYIHLQVIQFSHHLDLHFVIVGFVIMAVIGWHVLSYTQCTGPPFINFWPICLPPIRPLLHIPFINSRPKKIA